MLLPRRQGTNEYCRLDQLPEDGDEDLRMSLWGPHLDRCGGDTRQDVEVGPEIRKINQKITHVAGGSSTRSDMGIFSP